MGLAEAIAKAQAALEKLQAGTYEIISRSAPATWEELREDLEEKLVPILKKLYDQIGGLMQQPTVVLPDGVTSTSLVSQSEMTQFVTNTLNTWLADLEARIKEARKNTIYTLAPAVLSYKYVPYTVTITPTPALYSIVRPVISTTYKETPKIHIHAPIQAPTLPIITITT